MINSSDYLDLVKSFKAFYDPEKLNIMSHRRKEVLMRGHQEVRDMRNFVESMINNKENDKQMVNESKRKELIKKKQVQDNKELPNVTKKFKNRISLSEDNREKAIYEARKNLLMKFRSISETRIRESP